MAAVVRLLHAVRAEIRAAGIDGTDVRLCVWGASGEPRAWDLKSGDVGFDIEHAEFCGASGVNASDTAEDLEETASDLMEQVMDQRADKDGA